MSIVDRIERAYSAFFLFLGIVLGGTLCFLFTILAGTTVGVYQGIVLHRRYWYHVWIGFDRFCNAVLGGDSRETVSSRLGKAIYHGHPNVFGCMAADKTVSWWLSQVDPNHCKKSVEWEFGRSKAVGFDPEKEWKVAA